MDDNKNIGVNGQKPRRKPPVANGEGPRRKSPVADGEGARRKPPVANGNGASRKQPVQTNAQNAANNRQIQSENFRSSHQNIAKTKYNEELKKKRVIEQQKHARKNAKSRKVGITLAVIQLVISTIFLGILFILDMLPYQILVGVGVVLILIDLAVVIGQLKSRKKAITGKIVSVIMILSLCTGSYYLGWANSTLNKISGGDTKLDHIVVAVLETNSAETLQDAAEYSYGVEYGSAREDIEGAIAEINKEVGHDINIAQEYNSLLEQAQALLNGEVQAIIYNEAFIGMLDDSYPDFESKIKVLYTHEIRSKLELAVPVADVKVKKESFVVYISGIDVFGKITKNSRSDVNMLAVINPKTHKVLLVNTPRDYYVQIPGVSGEAKDKLTHAGIYGVDKSIATLSSIYDIEIPFYTRVNFTSLIEMVDALGGIDVHSEHAFTSIAHANMGAAIHVKEGMNHFDGREALIFSRERKNLPGGDNQRGKNQQAVIEAMIQKAMTPAILSGAMGLLKTVGENVETNMTNDQIQDLVKMQISKNPTWDIQSIAVTGTNAKKNCYSYSGGSLFVMEPNQGSVDEAKAKIAEVLAE